MSVIASFAEVLLGGPDAGPEMIFPLMQISERRSVLGFLSEVRATPALLVEIAKRSYSHNNGFDKITLQIRHDDVCQPRLRLHIWWPESRALSDSTIHNHAWDFATRLLCGRQDCELFEKDDAGVPFYHYECPTIAGKSNFPQPHFTGQVRLRSVQRCILSPPSGYSMSHSLIHRVLPMGDLPVASLVFQGQHQRISTSVFSSVTTDVKDVFPRRYFDPPELRSKLERIEAFLHHAG